MFRIATNIFEQLSIEEQEDIKKSISQIGDIELVSYKTKAFESQDIIKFIFDNFVLVNFIRDALLWDSLKVLLKKIYNISKRKTKEQEGGGVQIWLRDLSNLAPINVFLVIKREDLIHELMISLRQKLKLEIFDQAKESKKGKVILVGFDFEKNDWKVQEL